jgi:hypothetical protein
MKCTACGYDSSYDLNDAGIEIHPFREFTLTYVDRNAGLEFNMKCSGYGCPLCGCVSYKPESIYIEDPKKISILRRETGASMNICKDALRSTFGNMRGALRIAALARLRGDVK